MVSITRYLMSVRTIKIDGVESTTKNIVDGKYKIARHFYI